MNQTTTCVSSCHKQCMDSMFSRWYSSQNSHPCWKCIRHASGWKNSEQFSVSLNMGGGGGGSCAPVTFSQRNTDSALTPASSNTLPVFGESGQFYQNIFKKYYEDSTTVTSSHKTWVGRESERMQALE